MNRLCVAFLVCVAFVNADDGGYDRNEKWCNEDNCYDILGLDNSATHAEIKSAYKKQSVEKHPDKNPNRVQEAEAEFAVLAVAYEILGDPTKRKQYDNYLDMKRKIDSPRENPVLVAVFLFAVLAFCTRHYQNQQLMKVKKKVLEDGRVVRLLNSKHPALKIPTKTGSGGTPTADRKALRKAARAAKKKLGKDEEVPLEDKVSNSQIQQVLKELDIHVTGWNDGAEPSYISAAVTVAKLPVTGSMAAISGASWILKYYILKQDYSFADAESLCLLENNFDKIGWSKLTQEQRDSFLNADGPWRAAWRVERERRDAAASKDK